MPLEPNQFITKTDLTLQDAIDNSKPVPPWKRKLMNDLQGNKNSSTVIVDGVNDQDKPVLTIKQPRNRRKWLNIILIPMLLIHWSFVLITNLADLISDSFGEITINLANFIRHDAQAEPTKQQRSN